MRTINLLLLILIGISCQTNYYLSAPINRVPNIGLQPGLKSNGMLIASDANLQIDTAYFEKCLHSVGLYLETESGIKIKDEIWFHKSPDIAVLNELKTKYQVDGLLLLINLDVQKNSFDVPSGKFEYSARGSEPYLKSTGRSINWTNVNVGVISHWEYYDFTTGKSYRFRNSTGYVLELEEQVPDLEAYIAMDVEFLDPFFYQNGSVTAAKLIGEND